MVLKIKREGTSGNPDLRVKICDDLFKKQMEWRKVKMSIDKQNNVYEKTVINPETDEVRYHKKEALTSHTGRGSAKHKSKSTSGNEKR
jgi:hypothetical protein